MELDRSTIMFLVLVGIVFLGSFFVKESFVTDASGGFVSISIKDLISLLNFTSTPTKTKSDTNYDAMRDDILKSQKESATLFKTELDTVFPKETEGSDLDKAFKTEILQEVRNSVRDELQKSREGDVLSDECIDSVATQQGSDWMRYIPGKNPGDYIRKDSIPCYGCTLK